MPGKDFNEETKWLSSWLFLSSHENVRWYLVRKILSFMLLLCSHVVFILSRTTPTAVNEELCKNVIKYLEVGERRNIKKILEEFNIDNGFYWRGFEKLTLLMWFSKLRQIVIFGDNSVALYCSGDNPYFLWSSAEKPMAFRNEVLLNLDRFHKLKFLSCHLVLKFTTSWTCLIEGLKESAAKSF